MSKEIKDYIHFYLGCEIILEKSNYYLVHEKQMLQGQIIKLTGWLVDYLTTRFNINVVYKLLLRPLSDMTFEEKLEFPGYYCPEGFKWLLSKHFDLFGLIESGVAIDKTTLK